MPLSAIQKGKVAEMVVGAAIMHASSGRLTPFVPLADDNGLDLILFDKVSGMTTPVQVKARFAVAPWNVCEFNIRATACKAHYNGYLLAVHIDPKSMALEVAWLVPINALPVIAPIRDGRYLLSASIAENVRDKAAPYRHYSMNTIIAEIAPVMPTEEPYARRNPRAVPRSEQQLKSH
jgi:hypothetical protein